MGQQTNHTNAWDNKQTRLMHEITSYSTIVIIQFCQSQN